LSNCAAKAVFRAVITDHVRAMIRRWPIKGGSLPFNRSICRLSSWWTTCPTFSRAASLDWWTHSEWV